MSTRRFLTRVEATYELGLIDAATMRRSKHELFAFWVVRDVRVAVRLRDGRVIEAESGEHLHAEIYCRLARGYERQSAKRLLDGIELGFTVGETT